MRTRGTGHMQGCLCEGCIVNRRKREPILEKDQLVYGYGSDTLHHSINATQTLFVTGNRYREEKARLGYEGPALWPGDFVGYWQDEATRGSFVCWIETWHVHASYAQWGTDASVAQQHPDWGYWTTNKECGREE